MKKRYRITAEVTVEEIDEPHQTSLLEETHSWKDDPATDAQKDWLVSLGLWIDGMSKAAAREKIAEYKKEREEKKGAKETKTPLSTTPPYLIRSNSEPLPWENPVAEEETIQPKKKRGRPRKQPSPNFN